MTKETNLGEILAETRQNVLTYLKNDVAKNYGGEMTTQDGKCLFVKEGKLHVSYEDEWGEEITNDEDGLSTSEIFSICENYVLTNVSIEEE